MTSPHRNSVTLADSALERSAGWNIVSDLASAPGAALGMQGARPTSNALLASVKNPRRFMPMDAERRPVCERSRNRLILTSAQDVWWPSALEREQARRQSPVAGPPWPLLRYITVARLWAKPCDSGQSLPPIKRNSSSAIPGYCEGWFKPGKVFSQKSNIW